MNNLGAEAHKSKKAVSFDEDVKMGESKPSSVHAQSELWLEKYKPRKYDQLLTDEKTNRDILTWLKSWDEIVFKTKPKVTLLNDHLGIKKENKNEIFNKTTNMSNGFSKLKVSEVELTYKKHKVILLAGPPGIGKTTLAKVLAIHCGYEPLIINASDERTAEKLFQKIFDSTQIHNLSFNKKEKPKPTCLILDEIDGALDGNEGKSSINSIIEFVKTGKIPGKFKTSKGTGAKREEKAEKQDDEFEGDDDDESAEGPNAKSGKYTNRNSIKRPIICICNDLYAKVLKPLRKEALVFNFRKGNNQKLISRLKDICSFENIVIDTPTLRNLSIKSGSDIRLCVNSLQFISYNKKNAYFLNSLSKDQLTVLSSKDIGESIFDIWNNLFTYTKNYRFRSIQDLYFSNGGMDMINEGIYHNYLKVPGMEDQHNLRADLIDYLSFEDNLNKRVITLQQFELAPFQCIPGVFAKSRFSNRTNDKMNIEFPSTLIEFKRNKRNNFKVLSHLKETFEEEKRSHNNMKVSSFVTEYLPYLYQLIQPNIREINTELLNKQEKFQLTQAVSLLTALGIKINENEEHNYFDPDLKSLLDFKLEQPTSHRMTDRMRIILGHELETFKHFKETEKNLSQMDLEEKKSEQVSKQAEKKAFLGLGYEMIAGKKKSGQAMATDYKFYYKFNEGVTNKVTQSMGIKYFFQGNA